MRPEPVEQHTNACELAERWGIRLELAVKVIAMAAALPFGILIISGYRSPKEQEIEINRPDSTAAPVNLSNHTICPARAVDLDVNITVTNHVKATLGAAGVYQGLRWGGGAPVDPGGIPVDPEWRHFDMGPRPR